MSDQPPPPPSSQPPPDQPPPDSTAATQATDASGGKPWWKKWWGIVLIVLAVFIIIGALTGNDGDEEANLAADDEDDVEEVEDDEPDEEEEEEPEPEPEEQGEPEEPEEPAEPDEGEEEPEPDTELFESVTLEGTGDDVISIPTAPDHLLVATISHDGSSNFAIESHSADGDGDLLVNTIGSYSGTVPVNFLFEADELEITADGPWEIVISDFFEQPVLEDSIEGDGDQVLVVGTDANRLAITHDGESNFAVLAWGQQRDLLVNEIGAYDGTVRLGDALGLEINADGTWTINAE